MPENYGMPIWKTICRTGPQDFEQYDVASGKASGKVEAIKNPAPEAEAGFPGHLKGHQKEPDPFEMNSAIFNNQEVLKNDYSLSSGLQKSLAEKVRSLLTLIGHRPFRLGAVSLLGFNHGYENRPATRHRHMGFQ